MGLQMHHAHARGKGPQDMDVIAGDFDINRRTGRWALLFFFHLHFGPVDGF